MPGAVSRCAAGTGNPSSGGSRGIRVVIAGKGGVGKTTLTALLAHLFSRKGLRVLAVDGDPQQNLAVTLGVPPEQVKTIIPVAESAAYLREKTGAGPDISPGGMLTLNPDVSDVIGRFSFPVADNLRLLVTGGVRMAGAGCLCPEYTLLAAILRHVPLLPDHVVLLDTPAGMEHFGRAVADGFEIALLVTDTSYNALSVARESALLADQVGIRNRILVVNRSMMQEDCRKIMTTGGGEARFSRVVCLPADPEVARADPDVFPLLEKNLQFTGRVSGLADFMLRDAYS